MDYNPHILYGWMWYNGRVVEFDSDGVISSEIIIIVMVVVGVSALLFTMTSFSLL